jgi:hypothetical protein
MMLSGNKTMIKFSKTIDYVIFSIIYFKQDKEYGLHRGHYVP